MKTLTLGFKDFDENNKCTVNFYGFDGDVYLERDLGEVFFDSIKIKGSLRSGLDTSITTRFGMDVGKSLECKDEVTCGSDLDVGWNVSVNQDIKVGGRVRSGSSICAGLSLQAGSGIEVGGGIYAVHSVISGGGITARLDIEVGHRIFAGVCGWAIPDKATQNILCSKFTGIVGFGDLVETEKNK